MALTPKITNEDFALLAEGLKSAYRVSGNGGYELDIQTGYFIDNQDPAALLNAKQRVSEENRQLKEQLAAAQKEKSDAELAAQQAKLLKDKDFEGYKSTLDAQLQQIKDEHSQQLKSRDEATALATKQQHAMSLATEIFGEHAALGAPMVASRIQVKVVDGLPQLTVTDAFGNPQLGATVESLKKELLTDPRNAPIIVQSKATGSGATGSQPSAVLKEGGKFTDYSPAQLAEIRKTDAEAYQKLVAERDASKRRIGEAPLGSRPVQTT